MPITARLVPAKRYPVTQHTVRFALCACLFRQKKHLRKFCSHLYRDNSAFSDWHNVDFCWDDKTSYDLSHRSRISRCKAALRCSKASTRRAISFKSGKG